MAFQKALYLILDCETATLPFIRQMNLTPKERQMVSIAKPLIYDIGWRLIYRDGTVVKEVNYLVQETFFVPNVFDTAYYRDKRSIYMDKLAKGEITAKIWNDIANELLLDCRLCNWVGAYNAQFDFLKAIPFTECYIEKLYSNDYNNWEYGQRKSAENIANGEKRKNPNWDGAHFNFRGEQFDIVDIWRLAVEQLVNTFLYKNACAEFPMVSASGLYFKTSAESVFRYLDQDYSFIEAHTALDDARIESKIVLNAFNKHKKVEKGITAFPFRELGTTTDFLLKAMSKKKVTFEAVENVITMMESYLTGEQGEPIYSNFGIKLNNDIWALTVNLNKIYGADREIKFPFYAEMAAIQRKKNLLENARTPEFREQIAKELAALEADLNKKMFDEAKNA